MTKSVAALLTVLIGISGSAYGVTTKKVLGKVGKIKTRTELHTNTSVRGFVSFQIGSELFGPCTWIYFPESSQAALSLLLAAKAKNSTVEAAYYSDVISPFSGEHCALATIDES